MIPATFDYVAPATLEEALAALAEHGDDAPAECHDAAQHAKRIGPAVDEVADEPERVLRRAEVELAQQRVELGGATLEVADRIGGHRGTVAIVARVA